MKKKIFLITLFFCCTTALAQADFMYNAKGEKVYFKTRKDKILLRPDYQKKTVGKRVKLQKGVIRVDSINSDLLIVQIDTLSTSISKLRNNTEMVFAENALEYEDGMLQILTGKIFVSCRDGVEIEQVIKESKTQSILQAVEKLHSQSNVWVIEVSAGTNTMEIARNIYETQLCEFAEPVFIRENSLCNPYYSDQWGLENAGQYGGASGSDIRMQAAWGMTKGSPAIKVAVIDVGIDLTHPDLVNNILPGYNASTGTIGGYAGQASENDYHGTACAGIIAASDNSVGGVGIAPNCKIIPVTIVSERFMSDADCARGLYHSWSEAKADVLSCSWGGGSPSSAITNEVQQAATKGRNGLGSVVVFSTGNNNTSSINYPASLAQVIAVGAMSPCGERKSPTSCDTEILWGSQYGEDLSVVAPGVLIPTTDLQGTAGYNTQAMLHPRCGGTKITNDFLDTDYTISFNGTSAACPHVSGVAALMLSINPNLTSRRVKDIIEQTARKVGPYEYRTNKVNGYWHREMGYGLVDAFAAVYSAQQTPFSGAPYCTSTYSDQSVTSSRVVTGYNICVNNVVVTNGAKLTFEAQNSVVVDGSLEVAIGAEMEIK